MTTSKKKRSSTTLRISCPDALDARIIRLRRDPNTKRISTLNSVVSATSESMKALGIMISEPAESDHPFSEYIADQNNTQHSGDPANQCNSKEDIFNQRKRTTGKIIEEWLPYRDAFLHEILRHNGQKGLQVTICADCDNVGDFVCDDCSYATHYCSACMVKCHRLMPLHRIRVCKLILSVIWCLKLV